MKHDHSAFGVEAPFDPRMLVSTETLLAASENAYPIVSQRAVRKDRVGPMAGAVCALLLGGATFWSMASHRAVPHHQLAPTVNENLGLESPPRRASQINSAPSPSAIGQAPMVAPVPRAIIERPLPTSPLAAPIAAGGQLDGPAPTVGPDSNAVRHVLAPMLVVDGGSTVDNGPSGTINKDGSVNKDAAVAVDTPSATRMDDPARTISQGTLIPAVLETAIDSDLPGYARAVVTQDIYSFDRSQVLIPRSSRLIGEYKSGLADGQKRVYVTWMRLIRPDGVSIAIASPATSPSGGTGLPGQVNSHFVQRFGSAILLTIVGAASAVGSSGLVLAGSQNAASVAATHDAAIPPTIRIRPGQPLRVFTAHDLDFSTIATPSQ